MKILKVETKITATIEFTNFHGVSSQRVFTVFHPTGCPGVLVIDEITKIAGQTFDTLEEAICDCMRCVIAYEERNRQRQAKIEAELAAFWECYHGPACVKPSRQPANT